MKYAIEMKNIAFSYGAKSILSNFHLSIEEGKVYGLVGSSGSGKTTTLRLMNGLLKPQAGEVFIDGEKFDFSQGEKWRRSMGYSIQGSGLFPHMTLFENLTIIARKQGWDAKKVEHRAHELCELMNLPTDKTFLRKKPRQISGGQQQRIGIARALFMKPKVMLMDEPFSALDPITRSELQKEFLSLQEKINLTIVLVTHDLPEAFSMSHEIVLLNQGKDLLQGS
ncbi:MAG: ATP-binding cassette domain-containing protein [Pseudomonadota bacterium]